MLEQSVTLPFSNIENTFVPRVNQGINIVRQRFLYFLTKSHLLNPCFIVIYPIAQQNLLLMSEHPTWAKLEACFAETSHVFQPYAYCL